MSDSAERSPAPILSILWQFSARSVPRIGLAFSRITPPNRRPPAARRRIHPDLRQSPKISRRPKCHIRRSAVIHHHLRTMLGIRLLAWTAIALACSGVTTRAAAQQTTEAGQTTWECGRDVCCLKMEQEQVTKHCWDVECKKICVPPITFPWEGSGLSLFKGFGKSCSCKEGRCPKCTTRRCGKVRSIRVLKREQYEVTKCQCKWEVRRLPACRCDGACGGTCSQCRETAEQGILQDVPPAPFAGDALPIPHSGDVLPIPRFYAATSEDDQMRR